MGIKGKEMVFWRDSKEIVYSMKKNLTGKKILKNNLWIYNIWR